MDWHSPFFNGSASLGMSGTEASLTGWGILPLNGEATALVVPFQTAYQGQMTAVH